MREKTKDKGRLQDILEYSCNVEKLIKGYSFDDFVNDIRTYYAVMKNVEIVGEAAYMLTKEFKDTYKTIPWKYVQGMRHVLVHGYSTIDTAELYNTATNDIPQLRSKIASLLTAIDWDKWNNGE
ncbi:MAG: DUF86 domain-containing protein [Prevotella sp.]|nr:DUF86 domain-containing protein [Prevotella sp.]